MAVPLHLWLVDQDGTAIKGSSEVVGRDGSIEVLSLTHGVHIPTDGNTGKLTGARWHRPLVIEKEIDRSSAPLYQAVARAMTLQSATLKFYRANDAGSEEAYFTIVMDNVKVVSVAPTVPNIKETISQGRNHFETVEFRYEQITWKYDDGNMIFKDGWNLR